MAEETENTAPGTPAGAAAPPTDRTRVRRLPERGRYDHKTIQSILDEGIICHVAYDFEGAPVVIPTLYWHDDDHIYFHGSSASRMLRAAEGQRVCVAVTLIDALVLTRSAFHHSANYRSVVIHGEATLMDSDQAKEEQLEAMMDRLFPGRWDTLRPVNRKELKATRVLSVPLTEASAKVRNGPPSDDEEDLTWPAWAGLIPVVTSTSEPVSDGRFSGPAPEPAVLHGRRQ